MKNRIFKKMTLVLMGMLTFSLLTNAGHNSTSPKNAMAADADDIFASDPINTNSVARQYYAGINSELEGDELKLALYKLIHPKKCSGGYSAIWNYLPYCDADPDNPNSDSVIAFYRGTPATKAQMNKEHVWPNSRGGNYIEGDPHMVRPTLTSDNSGRGNDFYNEKPTSYDPASLGSEKYRGISARIIFYCAVQEYTQLSLADKNTDSTSAKTMGKLSTLLKWNLESPIDDTEILRNEVLSGARTVKGKSFNFNRNPFIDDRSLACKIWGDTNDSTRTVCAQYTTKPELESLTITPTDLKIATFSSVQLKAVPNPARASDDVTWTSSDSSIVNIDQNGLAYGVDDGVATITATSKVNGAIKATTQITVRSCKSLSISGTPTKTNYYEGEAFNPAGLTVTATYSDQSVESVNLQDIVWKDAITGATTLSKGTTKVIGYYGQCQVEYEGIQVEEAPIKTGYRIAFKDSGADGSSDIGSGSISSYVSEGSEYISSFSEGSKVYPGKYGLKLGSSSANGQFIINLSTEGKVNAKSINLGLAYYKATEVASVSVNDKGSVSPTSAEIQNYVLEWDGSLLEQIKVGSAKRCYISYIEVETQGPTTNVPVESVSLDKTTLNLVVDEEHQLLATVLPTNATNKNVTFTSSDNSIVSVTASGKVKALKAGNAMITVTTVDGAYKATCSVQVTQKPIDPIDDNSSLTNTSDLSSSSPSGKNSCGKSSANVVFLLAIVTLLGTVVYKKKSI